MLKFATIVLVCYAVYYALAIAYQLIQGGPRSAEGKKKEVYTVEGGGNEIVDEESATLVDDDISFSPQATAALKKKGK